MSIIKDIEVNSKSPVLNAKKWNAAAENTHKISNMLDKVLGSRFKGVFSPAENYEIGDYIWHDDEAYMIDKKNESNIIYKIDKYNRNCIPGKVESFYLNKEKQIVSVKNNSLDFETKISNEQADEFEKLKNEDYFVFLRNGRLYKMTNGVVNEYNFTINTPTVVNFMTDNYQIYAQISDYEMRISNVNNEENTEYKNSKSDETKVRIIDIAIDNNFLYTLAYNGTLRHHDKTTGEVLYVSNFAPFIKSIEKVKICSVDEYTIYLYDGTEKISSFHKTQINGTFIHLSEIKSIKNTEYLSMKKTGNYIAITTDINTEVLLCSKYSYRKIDLKKLVTSISTTKVKDAIFAVDFTQGQLVSIIDGERFPIDYSESPQIRESNIKHGKMNVKLSLKEGLELNKDFFLSYKIEEGLIGKTIFVQGLTKGMVGNRFDIGNYTDISGKRIPLKIFNKGYILPVRFKTFITVMTNGDKIEINYKTFVNGQIIENYTETNIFSNDNKGELYFNSNIQTFLENVVIYKKIKTPEEMEELEKCDLIIPFGNHSRSIPYSILKRDAYGNSPIRFANNSLITDNNGTRVNTSDEINANEKNKIPSMTLAINLSRKINEISEVLKTFSVSTHNHTFAEILNVPSASVLKAGIVSLSNSLVSDSQNVAATCKALAEVWKKANHEHPYLVNNGTYDSICMKNWFKSIGATGWSSETYGGKIFMQDTNWIRHNKSIYCSGEGAFVGDLIAFYSDERLKKGFKPMKGLLDIVNSITPYEYYQNELAEELGYPKKSEIQIGFKAQDLEVLIPEVVKRAAINNSIDGNEKLERLRGTKDFLSVDYAKLSVILWGALKELDEKVNAIDGRL